MKKSFCCILIVSIFSAVSFGETSIVLKDDPELLALENELKCSNYDDRELHPEDDSIEFFSSIYDEKTDKVTHFDYKPFFKVYADENLKEIAPIELKEEGLFINKDHVCVWWGQSCKSATKEFLYCNLYPKEKNPPSSIHKICPQFAKYSNRFKIEGATKDYFSILIDKKKYFINRSETPQYKLVESNSKKVNFSKEKLYAQINKDFKKHQNEFIDYVEKQKKRFELKDKEFINEILNRGQEMVQYLCFDNKLKCEKDPMTWGGDSVRNSAKEFMVASLPECFNYDKMKIDVSDYKDDKKLRIFTVLNGYDRNLICAFDIVLNEKEKDQITVVLTHRINLEAVMNDYENSLRESNQKLFGFEFNGYKRVEASARRCGKLRGATLNLPSRLHDKSIQMME